MNDAKVNEKIESGRDYYHKSVTGYFRFISIILSCKKEPYKNNYIYILTA